MREKYITKKTVSKAVFSGVSLRTAIEKTHQSRNTSNYNASETVILTGDFKTRKLRKLRKVLMVLTGLNAVLNGGMSVLGYAAVKRWEEKTTLITILTCILLLLSIFQTVLVSLYWNNTAKYYKIASKSIHLTENAIESQEKSKKFVIKRGLECVFHLFTPLPGVNYTFSYRISGKLMEITLNTVLYFAILIRNYHTFRFLHWNSQFSSERTQIICDFFRQKSQNRFTLRCYIATYGFEMAVGLIIVMILVPGVVISLLEVGSDVYSGFWVVAYTQLTIGYGEESPPLFTVQVVVLVSCVLGILTLGLFNAISSETLGLNLRECNLYSELLYHRHQSFHRIPAVTLLQRWWRLMLMRKRHHLHVRTIIPYHSQQLLYRSTLVSSQRVKDTRFERQIDGFDRSVTKAIRRLNEYLGPVTTAFDTVRCM